MHVWMVEVNGRWAFKGDGSEVFSAKSARRLMGILISSAYIVAYLQVYYQLPTLELSILSCQIAMELPQAWFSEPETEGEEFMTCDEIMNICDAVNNGSVDSYSPQTYTENMKLVIDQSFRTDQQDEIIPDYYQEKCPPSNTFTLSFGHINPKTEIQPFPESFRFEAAYTTKVVTTTAKNNFQAQDHVLAERKRREKLNQHFISLSALIPKLRKMDKATLLEDASNYIKELQDRVKELEGLRPTKRKDVQECVVSMKRSNNSSPEETESGESTDPCELSPEIEVRISGSSVLVRIQCKNKISSLVNTVNLMQKLGLSVISSNTMPFANTTILITVIAQIEDDFCMTTKELVKNLQEAI
ncbi:hypothetical protein SSX86_025246 [Deinandra increscens subsp. villosa]|uniref:BHLH domain-containing protein n=1 Tax=Deinandra increscens subsp. villosa TaxID=3103831 RepID=A0AAP0CC91_9ASTR